MVPWPTLPCSLGQLAQLESNNKGQDKGGRRSGAPRAAWCSPPADIAAQLAAELGRGQPMADCTPIRQGRGGAPPLWPWGARESSLNERRGPEAARSRGRPHGRGYLLGLGAKYRGGGFEAVGSRLGGSRLRTQPSPAVSGQGGVRKQVFGGPAAQPLPLGPHPSSSAGAQEAGASDHAHAGHGCGPGTAGEGSKGEGSVSGQAKRGLAARER